MVFGFESSTFIEMERMSIKDEESPRGMKKEVRHPMNDEGFLLSVDDEEILLSMQNEEISIINA